MKISKTTIAIILLMAGMLIGNGCTKADLYRSFYEIGQSYGCSEYLFGKNRHIDSERCTDKPLGGERKTYGDYKEIRDKQLKDN